MKKADTQQFFKIDDALEFVKKNCKAKFDSTVELHINTSLDVTKADQQIRTTVSLPNGTGKKVKVAVFSRNKIKEADFEMTDEYLEKLKKGKIDPKKDFDVIITEPQYMPKLANVARTLGPAGLMPSPKAGTVTDDVEKAISQIKKGKITLRTEPSSPLIHTILGKKSFSSKELAENFEEVWAILNQAKPQKAKPDWIKSVFVSCTMSPSAQFLPNK